MFYTLPRSLTQHVFFRKHKKTLYYTTKEMLSLLEDIADNRYSIKEDCVSLWTSVAQLLSEKDRALVTARELITEVTWEFPVTFFELLTPEQRIKWIYHVDMLPGDFFYATDVHTRNIFQKLACFPVEMLDKDFLKDTHCIRETLIMIFAGYLMTQKSSYDVIKEKCEQLWGRENAQGVWYKVLWLTYLHGDSDITILQTLSQAAKEWIADGQNDERDDWGFFRAGRSVLHYIAPPLLQKAAFEALPRHQALDWITELLCHQKVVEDEILSNVLEIIPEETEYPWASEVLVACMGRVSENTPLHTQVWLGVLLLETNTYLDEPVDVALYMDMGLFLLISSVFDDVKKHHEQMQNEEYFDVTRCVDKIMDRISQERTIEEVGLHW